jgi:hypothetical protein
VLQHARADHDVDAVVLEGQAIRAGGDGAQPLVSGPPALDVASVGVEPAPPQRLDQTARSTPEVEHGQGAGGPAQVGDGGIEEDGDRIDFASVGHLAVVSHRCPTASRS